jgi:hypothetical protein
VENTLEVIICFESVSSAIMAEQALRGGAFDVRVMPVPSSIRGGCGFCLRFSPKDIERAAAFLSGRGFDVTDVWEKAGEGAAAYRKININMENNRENNRKTEERDGKGN